MHRNVILAAGSGLLLIGAAIAACAPPDRAFDGHAVYAAQCAACHGADGTGREDVAQAATVPDLTRMAARNDGVFPMLRVIERLEGYGLGITEIARSEMPRYGLLMEGELMRVETAEGLSQPVPAQLVAIARHLESIQRTPDSAS